MALDPRRDLVIIKGKDQTDNVSRITRETTRTVVSFKSGKSYRYAPQNIECLSDPTRLPIDNARLLIDGDIFSDIEEVLRFGNWVKVFSINGNSKCCLYSEIKIQSMISTTGRSKDLLAYFRELAENVSLKTQEGDSLLALKFKQLNIVSRNSILSNFLQARSPAQKEHSTDSASRLIFPFGCNLSQKAAVQKAVQNPISLIQGPPGTGKTQTILNLIANMLCQNKRIAVVSNNNSATANVLEKLEKYELGFMAAFLGSTENKTAFIESQTGAAVEMPSLQSSQIESLQKNISTLNQEIDKAFERKNELASVIQQVDALRLEWSHFEGFLQESNSNDLMDKAQTFRPNISAKKLMHAWLTLERKAKRYAKKDSSSADFASQPVIVSNKSVGLLERIGLLLRFGKAGRAFFKLRIEDRITLLQKAYYLRRLEELESRKKTLESSLLAYDFDKQMERLTELSMQLLKHQLAKQYNNRARRIFDIKDLWKTPEEFLNEYPVILSTTFSVITSIRNGYLFDCVIVDEASQVDLLNGALAMGCAKKLVVVGDAMQLPNVLTKQDKDQAKQVAARYAVPEHARYDQHSLLSAVQDAFHDIPKTLLREHYRCHPKIIQFCNENFYGGELLIMTSDHGESDVIKVYMTVEGRHARGMINQRQIDEITQHILPELGWIDPADIGIVSPYRAQTVRMKESIGPLEVEVDTVHKYQGREKRVMIITTVANETNDFVDNPNLLNVAISRAQDKLRLVVSKEMTEGNGNIADFVRYVRYNNGEVIPGRIRSVFDLLYSEYTAARLGVLKNRKRISKYDSENLAFGEIQAVLQTDAYQGYNIAIQFPLSMLVNNTGYLTAEESAYAAHPWTKTDFLIYRKVDKQPVLVIEIDGYAFHQEGTRQADRDKLKDSILEKCGMPILRLSTIESGEQNRIRKKLEEVVGSATSPA